MWLKCLRQNGPTHILEMGFCWIFRIKQLHHNHRGSLLFGFVNEPVLFSLTQSPWPDLFTWLVSIRQSDNYSNAPREDERHSICVRVSNTRDCLSPSHACPLSCEKNTKLYVMPWASLMFWHLTCNLLIFRIFPVPVSSTFFSK